MKQKNCSTLYRFINSTKTPLAAKPSSLLYLLISSQNNRFNHKFPHSSKNVQLYHTVQE